MGMHTNDLRLPAVYREEKRNLAEGSGICTDALRWGWWEFWRDLVGKEQCLGAWGRVTVCPVVLSAQHRN